MFKRDDFNENVDYCEYVFKKNEELALGLRDNDEIQRVANEYAFQMQDLTEEEYEENDLLLINIVKDFILDGRVEPEIVTEEDKAREMELKAFLERQANTHGGYGLYEGYGDVDQTELDEGPKLS